jgi:hypothetical protein
MHVSLMSAPGALFMTRTVRHEWGEYLRSSNTSSQNTMRCPAQLHAPHPTAEIGVYQDLDIFVKVQRAAHMTFVGRCVSRQSLGGTPSQFRKARPNELGSSKPKR